MFQTIIASLLLSCPLVGSSALFYVVGNGEVMVYVFLIDTEALLVEKAREQRGHGAGHRGEAPPFALPPGGLRRGGNIRHPKSLLQRVQSPSDGHQAGVVVPGQGIPREAVVVHQLREGSRKVLKQEGGLDQGGNGRLKGSGEGALQQCLAPFQGLDQEKGPIDDLSTRVKKDSSSISQVIPSLSQSHLQRGQGKLALDSQHQVTIGRRRGRNGWPKLNQTLRPGKVIPLQGRYQSGRVQRQSPSKLDASPGPVDLKFVTFPF